MEAAGPRLSPTFAEAHQRRRALAAVAELAHEHGIEAVTAADICREARIGQASYHHLFGSHSTCLRQAFEEAFTATFGPVAAASGEREGPGALEAGIGAFFAAVAADPLRAELCLLQSLAAPESAAGHDAEAGVEILVGLMSEEGRNASAEDAREPRMPPEEYLARALVFLARERILRGRTAELPQGSDKIGSLVRTILAGPGPKAA